MTLVDAKRRLAILVGVYCDSLSVLSSWVMVTDFGDL